MRSTIYLALVCMMIVAGGCATPNGAAGPAGPAGDRPVAPFPIQPLSDGSNVTGAAAWNDQPVVTVAGKTSGDFSAVVQFKYDRSALYVRCVAKDNSVRTAPDGTVTDTSSQLFQFDSFEFWIGRHQFSIAYLNDKLVAFDYLRFKFLEKAVVTGNKTADGIEFVAKLPWEELEVEGKPGAMFQLAVQINDVDEIDGKRTRNTYAAPDTFAWGDAQSYGAVFLNHGLAVETCAKQLAPLFTPKIETGAQVPRERLTIVPNPMYAPMTVRCEVGSTKATAHLIDAPIVFNLPPAEKASIRRVSLFATMNGQTFGPESFEYFSSAGNQLSEYRSDREPPADFDAFWNARLKELAAVPMDAVVEKYKSNDVADAYRVTLRGWRDVKFVAYVSVPKAEGKFPLTLWVYPAEAIDPSLINLRADEVVLLISPRGLGESEKYSPPPRSLYVDDCKDPADFYLTANLMDDVRAIDYAIALPKTDPKRVFVAGGSRGGYLSMAIAAVDQRVTFCSSVSPCYADVDLMGRVGFDSAAHDAYLAIYGGSPERQQSMAKVWGYFDVLSFATRIHCPIIVETGMLDTICPSPGIVDAFNRIPSKEKILVINPEGGHGGLGVGEQISRAMQRGYRISN